jgi:hypothetical protein
MIAMAAKAKANREARHARAGRGTGRGLLMALGFSGLCFFAVSAPAQADTRLTAHYTISMIGVSVGQIIWVTDIGEARYTSSASGKASGALSILVNGEGRVAARGTVQPTRLAPTFFSSNVTDDGEISGLQMTFENGGIKTLRRDEPMRKSDRIPVSDADRQGVSDPLSAMLIAGAADETPLSQPSCDRTLAIFDGQRRYNLTMSFKRLEMLKIEHGYAGPALVCGVVLEPIAGYRPDSLLVKYVGGRRDMELWFAPIAGTAFAAPVSLLMPSMLGTLKIVADRFEAVPLQPAPPAASSAPAAVSEPAEIDR